MLIDIVKALFYGILEGITEWLPISSTGHLILLSEVLSFAFTDDLPPAVSEAYAALFDVVIQVGAILAVVVAFFDKLNPFSPSKTTERRDTLRLWGNLLVGSIPAAVIGLLADRLLERFTGKGIDGHLFRPSVVAAALMGYGILFLLPERKKDGPQTDRLSHITAKQALGIGCFQTLALIPGTSRSGSTILGAQLLGLSRSVAAEFSFLLGVPAIGGAALLQVLDFCSFLSKTHTVLPAVAWILLMVASVTAFGISKLTIRFLTDFVKKHSFAPFGIYRILLGILILLLSGIRSH